MTSVAGILLAAGLGSRIGKPKALLRWNGTLLVDHGIGILRAGGCDPILAVLGAGAEEVRRGARLEAVAVLAEDWVRGMGSSLAAGLAAAEETDADAAVIALVDQPFVSPEAVKALVAAYDAGASVAVAEYDGAPRNPVLIARRHWAGVARAVEGTDRGARQWLEANDHLVVGVECGTTGTPEDLDHPADLVLLQRYSGKT